MSKTHVIDGKTYVEVERKAKVGEKVVVADNSALKGRIGEVMFDYYDGGVSVSVSDVNIDYYPYLYADEYYVLAEVGEEPSQPTSTEDIIANLVRRVASLESQLRDTQNNVERQGVEIAEVTHRLSEKALDIECLFVRSDIDNIANEIAKMIRRGGAR